MIKQIISHREKVLGLDENNDIYRWDYAKASWELYCAQNTHGSEPSGVFTN